MSPSASSSPGSLSIQSCTGFDPNIDADNSIYGRCGLLSTLPLTLWIASAVFAASLGVMSWASVRITSALEHIGARLRFSEALLGVVTALGADAPDICSAFTALISDQHEVGLGVVLGSTEVDRMIRQVRRST